MTPMGKFIRVGNIIIYSAMLAFLLLAWMGSGERPGVMQDCTETWECF